MFDNHDYLNLIEEDVDYGDYNVNDRDIYFQRALDIGDLVGKRLLAYGRSRAVYKYNETEVLKLALNRQGLEDNDNELSLINHLKSLGRLDLLSLLPEIITSFVGGYITDLCEVLDNFEFYESDLLLNSFKESGIFIYDILRPEQFGVFNGNLVLLDFSYWSLGKGINSFIK